ncbi:MAG: hypothetical protein ABI811_03285 [Acidobacteriota bacterium]
MSFNLPQTPTLEAVSTHDEKALAQNLQARVAEAVEQTRCLAHVAAALTEQTMAAERLARLRIAERALNHDAKQARQQLDQTGQAALDMLVEAAASGASPDWSTSAEVASLEARIRFTGRAIERLTEHLIPLAHIASLREESHAFMAQARALEALAQERAEKVLGQIREAVSGEMILPVDMSKGVAGALLTQSRAWKEKAVKLSEEADGLQRAYQDRA